MATKLLTYVFAALLLSAGLVGCSSDNVEPGTDGSEKGDAVPIRIEIPVDNGIATRADDALESLRVMVFDSSSGALEESIVETYSTLDLDSKSVVLDLYPGRYDFFIFANEGEMYRTKLEGISNLSELLLMRITEIITSGESQTEPGYAASTLYTEEELYPFPRSAYRPGISVRENPDDLGNGQILDNNADYSGWKSSLDVGIEHVMAKMNISIRKQTPNPYDKFFLTRITLLQMPMYAYAVPAVYNRTGSERYNAFDWYLMDGTPEDNDWFVLNSNDYVNSNYTDILIPEFIKQDKFKIDNSVAIRLTGDYYQAKLDDKPYDSADDAEWAAVFNNPDSPLDPDDDDFERWGIIHDAWAVVPVGTMLKKTADDVPDPDSDYNIYRNMDYRVRITITRPAEFEFQPEITYEVLPWDAYGAEINIGGAISADGSWTKGTPEGTPARELWVSAGDYVEYTFKFSRAGNTTEKIRWNVSLTNPADYTFDTPTGGIVSPEENITIRVKVRDGALDNTFAQLIMAVDSGDGRLTEISLTEDPTAAPANRYSIHKIPE